jgi:hypothetical protein
MTVDAGHDSLNEEPKREAPSNHAAAEPLVALPQAPSAKKLSGFSTLLLHLHPRMVNEDTLKLNRTFGLGGVPLLLFLILIVTGGLLLFVYESNAAALCFGNNAK